MAASWKSANSICPTTTPWVRLGSGLGEWAEQVCRVGYEPYGLTPPPAHPGMAVFLKNVTFHGILLDALFDETSSDWQEVVALVRAGIQDGVVQPLKCTVFPKTQVEDAFRYMAQGKHIGKVVVQVRRDPDTAGSGPYGRHMSRGAPWPAGA